MYSSESSDYESDCEFNSKKFFSVELPDDFDPSKPPSTGEEYLQHVVYEARKCQRVASVNVDSRKFEQNQTIWVPNTDNSYVTAPKSMLPSKAWQENIVKEFSEYREYVSSRLPKTPNPNKSDYSFWVQKMSTEYPQLTVISDFNCCDQSLILEQIIHKLQNIESGCSIDNLLGCWIYNILSILDKPMNPDKYLLLRDLSRLCSVIRSKLPNDASSDLYVPLNVFICIVGRCFGQLDLTDT
ncbi:hypothetical protein RN001_012410 [Aquatica leii]|uniref:Gem-associated protein 2 n=1 Tax=Aquatica leii TaxID=1421715 RepID=A0AAN7QEU7_9COLE|nr:hypothetical protein RN001_012410 [Aquatica leii]